MKELLVLDFYHIRRGVEFKLKHLIFLISPYSEIRRNVVAG